MRPLLAIGAAWLLTQPGALPGRLRGVRAARGRALVAGLFLVLLAFSWWRDAPMLWDMLTTGGQNYRLRLIR